VAQSGGCNFCHVQDKSSDENPKKVMARAMIEMVKDINAKVATAASGESSKVYVTCYTCHRGKQQPETAAGLPTP
jgi:photosynthetic reaction center cytochrome c subunit